MRLKSDFLRKYFHFFANWGSFQGQGHFGALRVIFGFHSSMPIIIYRFYRSHGICAILAVIGLRCGWLAVPMDSSIGCGLRATFLRRFSRR